MAIRRLLIANRGEISIRIARAAVELGIETVAVHTQDDAASLHASQADSAVALPGTGAAGYLDIDAVVAAAVSAGCDAIHPGYGFLSENAEFAAACGRAGVLFVGPSPDTLRLFGDKARARAAARAAGVRILDGSDGALDLEQAEAFFAALPSGTGMVIKALAGGGGRGMRVVTQAGEVAGAYERCRSEAQAAFGDERVYAEAFMPGARHIEVQIVGDGERVAHLFERECSLQRRHQKLVEIAPSPWLSAPMRQQVVGAAVALAGSVGYRNIGTFEFLVDSDQRHYAFIEANPRLQVEHTVTEQVTGFDLVLAQLQLAAGATLADLGLDGEHPPEPRGFAIQVRVNMERMTADGGAIPTGGTLSAFDVPSGPGVRTDTFGYVGYETSPRYDSLLAKVIGYTPRPDFAAAVTRTYRALCEFRIEGVETNLPFLKNLLRDDGFRSGQVHTRYVDEHAERLVAPGDHPTRGLPGNPPIGPAAATVGARVDAADPLAVLTYGRQARDQGRGAAASASTAAGPAGSVAVLAPLQGTVIAVDVAEGDTVVAGTQLMVMESMKMEHEIRAAEGGIVRRLGVQVGDTVREGHPLAFVEPGGVQGQGDVTEQAIDPDHIRPDLAEVVARHDKTLDRARPDAVAKRHERGQRTARENIEDLCDPGSFLEFGGLVLAAQRRRRTLEDLIDKTPADGMITGVGSINGALFEEPASRCVVMSYDYTVLAGTQGGQNHRKTDRMIDVAEEGRMPLVLFSEGGGGRPGDTDGIGVSTQTTFSRFAQLSALVPMIGVTSGRCFAGNASLLGCCDVIIATAGSNIGMGGPAMIEGGGLGVYAPEEIGGMDVQVPNGVVDIAVADEAEAVAVAKRYLSYFQGRVAEYQAPDQRLMRQIVPENRLRVYDIRRVIETLADVGSVLELRRGFGHGMVTSLIRVDGRPLGVIANNPHHLGGAIDSDAADKATRFMQVCDAFDLPLLYLCDTPGIMVGPEVERTALVRHSSRMFLIGANLSVPFFTIVIRKAYGLGAIAMSGGSHHTPLFSVAWPTGEFGGMGLEGSVKLGYRNELAAIEDPQARRAQFEQMVERAYQNGKALNYASLFGVDDTIDPADSRRWVAGMLASVRTEPRRGKKRPAIDGW
jgi:acetyl/propionyl-CoA carboxylase alpha subunit/acetyl-CoA carboxylase carboxyltransferase component